jgi:hypothetical protein
VISDSDAQTTEITFHEESITADDLGVPCFRAAPFTISHQRELIGILTAIEGKTGTITNASAYADWVINISHLVEVHHRATDGSQDALGAYTWHVKPSAKPSKLMCLDVESNSVTSGALIQQRPCATAPSKRQEYYLDYGNASATAAMLVSNQSGLCVEVPGSSTASNVAVKQAVCTGAPNQRFNVQLVTVGGASGYLFKPTHKAGMCLRAQSDIAGLTPGLSIVQATCPAEGADLSSAVWYSTAVAPH